MKFDFKHIATSYLLLLFMIKMMALPIILLQYNVNKSYITANYCENLDKPALHCYGSCHVKKQLAKTVETPGSQENQGAVKISTIDFFEHTDLPSFATPFLTAPFHYNSNNSLYADGYYPGIFHPPSI